jgi:small nuclear ribonucleoprotein E
LQGFDEFMNLVIDDAVEVKQATKTTEESRRSLGWFHKGRIPG